MFQNIQSQFDLIFGKGSPLLATPPLQAAYDDDEDELDESWDDTEDCEGCPDDDDHWEEDCDDDWLEDDYDSDEDEGTEYRNSSDCLIKAIEKANDSLDD